MTAPSGSGRHLVLIGMMGAGKSTIGASVAAALGRPFVDVDEQIEVAEGRTIPEIFEVDGEDAFRAIEREVLEAILSRDEPTVVAAGGGAILDAANRTRMRERGTVVWLRASPDELAGRIGDGAGRPLLASDDPAERLSRLAVDREPLYREAAHEVIDVDQRSVEEITGRVVDTVIAAGHRSGPR